MLGLRARQKADRHNRILEAAAALFREHGYDAVKMEAIANDAQVSIGSIYNYYQNKGDLLVAIVAMEVHEVLASGEKHLCSDMDDAILAVNQLFAIYVTHSLVYLSKEMWRHAMAISIQQPESPFGTTYAELDLTMTQQTCDLMRRLQVFGLIRPVVNASVLGEVLFNNTNMMFINFIKSDSMEMDELLARLREQTNPIISAVITAAPSQL